MQTRFLFLRFTAGFTYINYKTITWISGTYGGPMKKRILFIVVMSLIFTLAVNYGQQIIQQKNNQLKVMKKPLTIKALYRFHINGIKRIQTTSTKVVFQVQYYISPNYPKPCFIGAYVPNKSSTNGNFGYRPAGRLPRGVPKGQKHFRDNIRVELHYNGRVPYTSRTLEVVIYDQQGTKKKQIIRWGQKWGRVVAPPRPADLIIQSISVSKYSAYRKTKFTVRVKNIGGTPADRSLLSVWFWKLNSNGSLPATFNEYWEAYVPAPGGSTIAPGQVKTWFYEKPEFLVEGNFRLKAKINPQRTATESNYNNNEKIYNFHIPN